MSSIRFIGKAKDRDGYPCEVLEDELTKAQYLAYSPETYAQRVRDGEEHRAHTRSLAAQGRGERFQVLVVPEPETPDAA